MFVTQGDPFLAWFEFIGLLVCVVFTDIDILRSFKLGDPVISFAFRVYVMRLFLPKSQYSFPSAFLLLIS